MKVLYITIGELGDLSAGSGLRPSCMYRAFLDRGHEVYVLSGHEGRNESGQRAEDVKKAKAWVEANQPDLCYIESSTYPMLHSCDYGMIRFLHKKKIPTGYFYRDFNRRFPTLFPRRSGVSGWLKEIYLDLMQWRTDRILKLLNTVYFPSEQCFPYFQYRNMKALPPAGERTFLPSHENSHTCIYVGGISERYGLQLLLDSFRLLNGEGNDYHLILVCRESEFKNASVPNPLPAWLEVRHTSGDDLVRSYEQADLGLIALEPNEYAQFAVCIKLFQYLSYGIPVLSTDVAAMREIIQKNHFGKVAPYDAEAYAQAIRDLLGNHEQMEFYRASIEKNMVDHNLWVHRVDQIVEDLVERADE